VDLDEEHEHVTGGEALGIEVDLDGVGMFAVVAAGRVESVTAGVANLGRDDSGPFPDEVLHSPEASASQDRCFICCHGDAMLPSSGRCRRPGYPNVNA
jgi:hypothetical protein